MVNDSLIHEPRQYTYSVTERPSLHKLICFFSSKIVEQNRRKLHDAWQYFHFKKLKNMPFKRFSLNLLWLSLHDIHTDGQKAMHIGHFTFMLNSRIKQDNYVQVGQRGRPAYKIATWENFSILNPQPFKFKAAITQVNKLPLFCGFVFSLQEHTSPTLYFLYNMNPE